MAATCYHRYSKSHPLPPSAHLASYNTPSYVSNWFPDTCNTHQVTPNLISLTTHEDYRGHDHLRVGNSKACLISNIRSTSLQSPSSSFSLLNMFDARQTRAVH